MAGAKKSSPLGPGPGLFGVFGDIACEPVEALIGVIWSALELLRSSILVSNVAMAGVSGFVDVLAAFVSTLGGAARVSLSNTFVLREENAPPSRSGAGGGGIATDWMSALLIDKMRNINQVLGGVTNALLVALTDRRHDPPSSRSPPGCRSSSILWTA